VNANHTRSHHSRRDIAQKWNSSESADKPGNVQCPLFLRTKELPSSLGKPRAA
jgi:hypothetical protein